MTIRAYDVAFTLLFLSFLGTAATMDWRQRKVANFLNAAILVVGMALTLVPAFPITGTGKAFVGSIVGLLLWLPFYAFRLIGAGDVKFFAASAAWLGWQHALFAALWTVIAGAIIGVWFLVRRRGTESAVMAVGHALRAPRLLQLQPFDRRERVPYALAIAAGMAIEWFRVIEVFNGAGR